MQGKKELCNHLIKNVSVLIFFCIFCFIVLNSGIFPYSNSLIHTHIHRVREKEREGRTSTSAPLCVNRWKSVTSISVPHCVLGSLCASICCPNILPSVTHSKLVCSDELQQNSLPFPQNTLPHINMHTEGRAGRFPKHK